MPAQEHLKRRRVGWGATGRGGLCLGAPQCPSTSSRPSGPPAWGGSTSCSDLGQGGVGVSVLLLDGGPEAVSTWGGGTSKRWEVGKGLSPLGGSLGWGHTGYLLGGSRQALWCRSRASAAATGASRPRPRPKTAASWGPVGRQGPLGGGGSTRGRTPPLEDLNEGRGHHHPIPLSPPPFSFGLGEGPAGVRPVPPYPWGAP